MGEETGSVSGVERALVVPIGEVKSIDPEPSASRSAGQELLQLVAFAAARRRPLFVEVLLTAIAKPYAKYLRNSISFSFR